jgi:ubiquitin-conjugating enzyme E2 J2
MDARRKAAVLKGQFTTATKEPHEWLQFAMTDNLNVWYIRLAGFTGEENEYTGGEYLVRVELPNDFPYKPPHFYFLTPQGLYGVETKVCISIGEYHPEKYRATLGVIGFCANLVSGLIGWKSMGGGIEIKNTSRAEKAQLAQQSHEYNLQHNKKILDQIAESYNAYSKKWVNLPAKAEKVAVEKVEEKKEEVIEEKQPLIPDTTAERTG